MNYTQLINRTLEKLELTPDDIYSLNINMDVHTITLLTNQFAKHVIPFPAIEEDDPDINQDPRPKRRKMVKRTG